MKELIQRYIIEENQRILNESNDSPPSNENIQKILNLLWTFDESDFELAEMIAKPNGLWDEVQMIFKNQLKFLKKLFNLTDWSILTHYINDDFDDIDIRLIQKLKKENTFHFDNIEINDLDKIDKFYWIKNLIIKNSNITYLPESVYNLINLQILNLEHNRQLTYISDDIHKLPNLRKLSLNRCKKISVLPESIGSLKNLIILSLTETQIKKIPDTIAQCQNLKEIHLEKTPLTNSDDVRKLYELLPNVKIYR